jgi:DHA1 family multidrug resistance protein-like MFS transporter
MTTTPRSRSRAWLDRWQGILPLLAAELIVWLGFGAMLPVLPLYFRDHGVDLGTMGLVIAAWPAARLLAEPAFGWLADRTRRVPLMTLGLLGTGLFVFLPLWLVGPTSFFVLRGLTGLASAMYDPAARGYLVDATPADRRGEAFGLYGAAQMGGLLLGPAVGGLGAAMFGGFAFVFLLCALASWLGAVAVWFLVKEAVPARRPGVHPPAAGYAGLPTDEPVLAGASAQALEDLDQATIADAASLWNRLLIAAVVIEIGSFYASGVYEVMWSLFLEARGAGLELIGLTFAMFGLPILLLSPYAGRLVDRRGVLPFIILGGLGAAICGVLYTVAPDPILFVPIILVEATGFAFLGPALFSVVAAGSPVGRSSTAQGLLGAAGTVGTIVASVTAGYLAEIDLRLPYWVFSIVMLVTLATALLIGGRAIARLAPARLRAPAEATDAAARTSSADDLSASVGSA